jgi:hypothetical protein
MSGAAVARTGVVIDAADDPDRVLAALAARLADEFHEALAVHVLASVPWIHGVAAAFADLDPDTHRALQASLEAERAITEATVQRLLAGIAHLAPGSTFTVHGLRRGALLRRLRRAGHERVWVVDGTVDPATRDQPGAA